MGNFERPSEPQVASARDVQRFKFVAVQRFEFVFLWSRRDEHKKETEKREREKAERRAKSSNVQLVLSFA